jgi:LPXTG-motif cell wall-anchored protein
MANSYIVEVESCETGEIIYSFKMENVEQSDIIPCLGRPQPRSCYHILFTIVAPTNTTLNITTGISNDSKKDTNNLYFIILGVLVLLTIVFFIIRKKRKSTSIDPNWIQLGQYYFDKRNTELIIKEQRIELTGKEADLLLLLYNSVNTTVERDIILNKVWGDEGDYIGRTLDVFISKLRKKLEFDSKVKIVNTRGVGYKLILDV